MEFECGRARAPTVRGMRAGCYDAFWVVRNDRGWDLVHNMSTQRFHAGDRVKTRRQILDIPAGAVGTVAMVYNAGQDVCIVRFDKYPGPRMIWGTDLEMVTPITRDGSAI